MNELNMKFMKMYKSENFKVNENTEKTLELESLNYILTYDKVQKTYVLMDKNTSITHIIDISKKIEGILLSLPVKKIQYSLF